MIILIPNLRVIITDYLYLVRYMATGCLRKDRSLVPKSQIGRYICYRLEGELVITIS